VPPVPLVPDLDLFSALAGLVPCSHPAHSLYDKKCRIKLRWCKKESLRQVDCASSLFLCRFGWT